MRKIIVILKREYFARVKNKTFIIMTFLAPLLIAIFYAAVFYVATRDANDKEARKVLCIDESGFFAPRLDSISNYHFESYSKGSERALTEIKNNQAYAILEIKDRDFNRLDSLKWISEQTPSLMQSEMISNKLAGLVYKERLQRLGLRKSTIDSLSPKTSLKMVEMSKSGELKSSSTGLNGAGVDTATEALAQATQQSNDVVVDLGAGHTVKLVGVSLSDLSSANFEVVNTLF